jgi:hypothetical protein
MPRVRCHPRDLPGNAPLALHMAWTVCSAGQLASGQRRFFAQCAAVWRSEFGPLRGKGRAGVLQCSSAGKAEHGRPVRRSGKPGGFPEAPHRRPLFDLGAIQLHLSGAHAVPFALFRAQQLPLFRKQSWFSTAIAGRWLFPASGLIWISESRFAGICGSR